MRGPPKLGRSLCGGKFTQTYTRTNIRTHMGFHVSGWKSDMLRQRRVLGLKRPLGVSMRMEGGFRGYSGGNLSLPW